MKRNSTVFPQAVIVLLSVSTIAFLLIEPQFEGRNVGATFSEIYFTDPFLVYAYLSSVPFFAVLYHTFSLLGAAGKNAFATSDSVRSLSIIQKSAFTMIVFIFGGVVWLLFMGSDDRPPIIAMGAIATLFSLAIACTASYFQKGIRKNVMR